MNFEHLFGNNCTSQQTKAVYVKHVCTTNLTLLIFNFPRGGKKYIFSSNVFQFCNIRIYINSHIQHVRKTGFIEQETTELFMVSQHEFDDHEEYITFLMISYYGKVNNWVMHPVARVSIKYWKTSVRNTVF
jgi:hypothetical protein